MVEDEPKAIAVVPTVIEEFANCALVIPAVAERLEVVNPETAWVWEVEVTEFVLVLVMEEGVPNVIVKFPFVAVQDAIPLPEVRTLSVIPYPDIVVGFEDTPDQGTEDAEEAFPDKAPVNVGATIPPSRFTYWRLLNPETRPSKFSSVAVYPVVSGGVVKLLRVHPERVSLSVI